MKKLLKIDNFILKIIACITMAIDHIGVFIDIYVPNSPTINTLVTAFKIIGRLAFPLYAFLIVEGALHTKSMPKYILRIGIMTLAISTFLLVFEYTNLFGVVGNAPVSNIFLLFLLSLTTIYCLKQKKWLKLLGLLPFGFILFVYLGKILKAPYMADFPLAFIPDYGLYGYLIIMGMYLLLSYYKVTVKKMLQTDDMVSAYEQTAEYKIKYNIFAILPLLIMTLAITVLKYVYPQMNTLNASIQSYAMLAAVPLFFYSGKLGFNNKVVKYGFYGFYPMHIILIWAIFTLIYL